MYEKRRKLMKTVGKCETVENHKNNQTPVNMIDYKIEWTRLGKSTNVACG